MLIDEYLLEIVNPQHPICTYGAEIQSGRTGYCGFGVLDD
jgi:hypothetical protein